MSSESSHSPSANGEPLDQRVERRCVELMFSQSRTAYASNIFCVALLLATFWNTVDVRWLLAWAGAGGVLMAFREQHFRQFRAHRGASMDVGFWARRLEWALLLNGCFWGTGCAALALVATPYQLPPIVLIVGGLQTGSVLASSYLLRAFALFSLPLQLLSLTAFVVLGVTQHPSLLATSAVLAVWSAFIMMVAKRFGANYRRSIARGLQNLDLATSLEEKNRENEALNASLKGRIDDLSIAQNQLLAQKERADGLVAQLRQLSQTDGLTGLGNRRSFDMHLASEWRRARRSGEAISLLLIDVDHFKAYNDHYGHQKGDECLATIARTLATGPRREGDLAARYGGEEFAIVLIHCNAASAAERAEHIRAAVAEQCIDHAASDTAQVVTLSIGAASVVPSDEDDPQTLISAADAALYDAKRQGRNQVVLQANGDGPIALAQ
ncbi:MAG: diguanylate cyclase [Pseudomonadota bacterium]